MTLEGGCHVSNLVSYNLSFLTNLHVYFVVIILTLTFTYLAFRRVSFFKANLPRE